MKRIPLPPMLTWRLFLYQVIFPIALLLMLPAMIRRMVRRGGFKENLGERFGIFSDELKQRLKDKHPIWIQSISVGETMIALKLAREIQATNADASILLSVTTSTGRELAEKAGLPSTEIIYNPVDLASVVRRVLDVVAPARLIVVEGFWPMLIAEAWRRTLPVAMIARLSPRSEKRFRQFRWFTAPVFGLLDPVCVPEPEDVPRWLALGARLGAVHCTGAIKFDEERSRRSKVPELAAHLARLGVSDNSRVLLGGSTFPGEESILVRCFLTLRKKFPDLFLILVPRHAERTPEILAELAPFQLRIASRTGENPAPADILLVNTTGELRDWYQLATLVFIGKSLTAIGGQNPVEAALADKPLLFGPHMENFAAIVEKWLLQNAVIPIQSESELLQQLDHLLTNPQTGEEMASRAKNAVAKHQGATARTADLISQTIH